MTGRDTHHYTEEFVGERAKLSFIIYYYRLLLLSQLITGGESPSHTPKVTITFDGPEGGGGEGTQQSFIRRGSTPRSKTLPFYIPVLIDRGPLSCTFHGKMNPFHIERLLFTERLLLETFYLRNPLKCLDESAVRCVCWGYFEVPFNA